MRKLLNRKIVEVDGMCAIVMKSSRITTMSFRITKSRRGCEEHGERSSGQYPSNTFMVQRRGGIDQNRWLTADYPLLFELLPDISGIIPWLIF